MWLQTVAEEIDAGPLWTPFAFLTLDFANLSRYARKDEVIGLS